MLYSNLKDLHAWLNQLRYDDLQLLAEKLGVNLPVVDGMVTAGHIYKCQLRIVDQVDNHVDPGQWHLFLGCNYPPFKNDPPVSTSRWAAFSPVSFFNRLVAPSAFVPFGTPTLQTPSISGTQDEIEAEVQVDCLVDVQVTASLFDNEVGTLEDETVSVEMMAGTEDCVTVSSACVQLEDIEMTHQDAPTIVAPASVHESQPRALEPERQVALQDVSPPKRLAGPVRSALKKHRSSCFNFKAAHQANKMAESRFRDVHVRFKNTETAPTSPLKAMPLNDDFVESAVATSSKVIHQASSSNGIVANEVHAFGIPEELLNDVGGSMDLTYEPFNIQSNRPGKLASRPGRVYLGPKKRLSNVTTTLPRGDLVAQPMSNRTHPALPTTHANETDTSDQHSFVDVNEDDAATPSSPLNCVASSSKESDLISVIEASKDVQVTITNNDGVLISPEEKLLISDSFVEPAGLVISPKVTQQASSTAVIVASTPNAIEEPVDPAPDVFGSKRIPYERLNSKLKSKGSAKSTVKPEQMTLRPRKELPVNAKTTLSKENHVSQSFQEHNDLDESPNIQIKPKKSQKIAVKPERMTLRSTTRLAVDATTPSSEKNQVIQPTRKRSHLDHPVNTQIKSKESDKAIVKPERMTTRSRTRLTVNAKLPSPEEKLVSQSTRKHKIVAQPQMKAKKTESSQQLPFNPVNEVDSAIHPYPLEYSSSSSSSSDGNATVSVVETCQPLTPTVTKSSDTVYEPHSIPRTVTIQEKGANNVSRSKFDPKASGMKDVQHVPCRAVLQPRDINVPVNLPSGRSEYSPINAVDTGIKVITEPLRLTSPSTQSKVNGSHPADKELAPTAPVDGSLDTGYEPFNIPRSINRLRKRPDRAPRTKLGSSKTLFAGQDHRHVPSLGVLQPKDINVPVQAQSQSLENDSDALQVVKSVTLTQDCRQPSVSAPAQSSTINVPALDDAADKLSLTIVPESSLSPEEKNTCLVQVRKRKADSEERDEDEHITMRPPKKAKVAGAQDESSIMEDIIVEVSSAPKSVIQPQIASSAERKKTTAVAKRVSKRKSVEQHPTSSSAEIDTTDFEVTPGAEKILWLPECHEFTFDVPAAIKLTTFIDVKPASNDGPAKAELPISQDQSKVNLATKRAFKLSYKSRAASKAKTLTGDQRKSKKTCVDFARKNLLKRKVKSGQLISRLDNPIQSSDNESGSSMDSDVVMEDVEEHRTRYPVLEAEWAAGIPQAIARDFLMMRRRNWDRSPALAQLENQVTTMNAIRFAYHYHGQRSPLD